MAPYTAIHAWHTIPYHGTSMLLQVAVLGSWSAVFDREEPSARNYDALFTGVLHGTTVVLCQHDPPPSRLHPPVMDIQRRKKQNP